MIWVIRVIRTNDTLSGASESMHKQDKSHDDTGLLLLIVLVTLIVTQAWLLLSKEDNAKVSSVVLTTEGCVAVAKLGIEFNPLPEGTCSVSVLGLKKYGDKLYVSDNQVVSANHVVAWSNER